MAKHKLNLSKDCLAQTARRALAPQPTPYPPDIETLLNLQHTVGNEVVAQSLPFEPELERVFGRDLSNFAVYTGVSRLNQRRAAAATVGDNLLFAQRQPPKEIVAHETAHALQNRNTPFARDTRSLAPEGGAAEAEADRAADAAMHGQSATVSSGSGGAIAHWSLFNKKKKPSITFKNASPMTPEQQGNVPSARELETQHDAKIEQDLETFESNAHPEINLPQNPTFQPLTMGSAGLSRSYWAESGDKSTGIFKPAKQEFDTSTHGGYKKGGGAIREVLGYELSQKLGGNVPKTRLMSGYSEKFNQVGRLNKGKEKYDPSTRQVGSYQELAQNTQSLSGYLRERKEEKDTSLPNVDLDSLQKIAIQDIMSLNTDRHENNILVDEGGKLIPIDHGQILPGNEMAGEKLKGNMLNQTYWAWQRLKGAEKKFSHKNKRLISGIKAKSLVNDLRTQTEQRAKAAGMKESTVSERDWLNLKLSTRTLQKAVRAGLSPAQIGGLYTGNRGALDSEKFEAENPGQLAPSDSPGELSEFLGGSGELTDEEDYKAGWKSAADAGIKRILGEEEYGKFMKREALRKEKKALRKQQPEVDEQPSGLKDDNKPAGGGGFFAGIAKLFSQLNPFKKREHK